jgi:hypothetical protein
LVTDVHLKSHPRVAALAGRRVDPPGSDLRRFPLERVEAVRDGITSLMLHYSVRLLICSAACGADLLALEAAAVLGLPCCVVLPYDPKEFRLTSVVDRPGNWGVVYDRVIAAAVGSDQLIVLGGRPGDDRAYSRATLTIIEKAAAAAAPDPALAVIVWEGIARKKDDATAEFRRLAKRAGFDEHIVSTR